MLYNIFKNQKNNVPPHSKERGLIGTCFLDDPKLKQVNYNLLLKNEVLIYGHKTNKEQKEKIPIRKPQIIIDIHEKNSLVPSFLQELGLEIIIQPLEVGDYLVNNTIIERKTMQDFISSMLSKRLVQQLINMQQYPKKLLILEGEQNKELAKNSKLNPNAIKGMILSTSLEFQIPIIKTKNEEETAIYLFLLAKRELKPQTGFTLHSRIPQTEKEQKKYILESFPKIGPATAEKLLKELKTLKNIFNATEEQLIKIIGSKAESFKILD